MAGLYISDAKLPEPGCWLIVTHEGEVHYVDFKNPYCVLPDKAMEVPGHGKLIDADTLADRLEKDRTFILHAMMEAHKKSEGYTREDYLFDRNGDMISILRNQAAVIPADRKEGEA